MENKSTILIVEDEINVADTIKAFFERKEYTVLYARDGLEAFKLINENRIDIVLLDLMLLGMSGEEICSKLRAISNIPIIIISAKSSEESKVKCFSYGADDFIVKPFSLHELAARCQAVLRRSQRSSTSNNLFFVGGFEIDKVKHIVKTNVGVADLTPCEYNIISYLINNAGVVVKRSELVDQVLKNGETSNRTIDVHIRNIRRKVETNPDRPNYIHTSYGIGYRFEPIFPDAE